jgi:hypothetical protein
MKATREKLLKEVEAVLPGISQKELIEQSSCIIFKDGKIYTYNDEISCRYDTHLKINGAVSAMPLINILRKMKEDEIEIEIGEGELLIKGNGRKSGIRMEKSIVLPIDSIDEPEKWHKLPDDFTEGLKYVSPCAGKDESSFALTCIHIHPNWLEACDNMQVSRYLTNTGFDKSVLARRDSIKYIISFDMTEFGETDSWIHFKNPAGLILSCRRYVEEFPDMEPILDVSGERTVLPKGIKEAVSRAEVFSVENVDNNMVTINLKAGKLRIKGEGASGWFSENKKIKYTGKDISFKISPSLLSELVQKHNECEITESRLKIEIGKLKYVTVLEKIQKSSK